MASVEFTQHIRFALQHLYEISVLDKGPGPALAVWLDEVAPGPSSPGQRLHQLLLRTIEQMKPAEPLDVNLPHHRSYLILKRRYLDGISVQQLEITFNSSSRQFRRENHRAIEELILALWQLSPHAAQVVLPTLIPTGTVAARSSLSNATYFDRTYASVHLLDAVMDAAQTLSVIIGEAQVHVIADIPPDLPPVTTDRVALRLAIIKLIRLAIAHSTVRVIRLHGLVQDEAISLSLEGVSGVSSHDMMFTEAAHLFELADATLTLAEVGLAPAPKGPPQASPPPAVHAELQQGFTSVPSISDQTLVVKLLVQRHPAVLVVDDDPAMQRIMQRFLALKPIRVLGCNSTDDVIRLAREIQPVLIMLDVLMPRRDGWEILQELKANPDTYHIQLAVCSIWDERELALALGADRFFQKPIDRAELLRCIETCLDRGPKD